MSVDRAARFRESTRQARGHELTFRLHLPGGDSYPVVRAAEVAARRRRSSTTAIRGFVAASSSASSHPRVELRGLPRDGER